MFPRHPRPGPFAATTRLAAFLMASVAASTAAKPSGTSADSPQPTWDRLLRMDTPALLGPGARAIATHILSHQSAAGDWPKNLDTFAAPSSVPHDRIEGTWDNHATVREVRWLGRYHAATGDARAGEAVRRALEQILAGQYPSGGWPQRHPPGGGYHRHITFNDGTYIHLLRVLDGVVDDAEFRWLPERVRARCRQARERGLACLLRCQVRRGGTPTVWGAQHDPVTLEPASARAFEPASLAAAESAGVLRYLMEIPNPDAAVTAAVEHGVRWFSDHGLDGIRIVQDTDGDRRVVEEPGAPRVWARFYDLAEERPLFCGRDGRPVRHLAEIERERRGGYAWYGTWGTELARGYSRWHGRKK